MNMILALVLRLLMDAKDALRKNSLELLTGLQGKRDSLCQIAS